MPLNTFDSGFFNKLVGPSSFSMWKPVHQAKTQTEMYLQ